MVDPPGDLQDLQIYTMQKPPAAFQRQSIAAVKVAIPSFFPSVDVMVHRVMLSARRRDSCAGP
jgi:hypothetical protein